VTLLAASVLAAMTLWLAMSPPAHARLRVLTSTKRPAARRRTRVRVPIRFALRRRRQTPAGQVVQVADLVASLLASGLDITHSMEIAADAAPQPAKSTLVTVARAMRMGAPPEVAWQSASDDPTWQPLRAALARSARSGAPLAGVLADAATDLRRHQLRALHVAARSAGVRAVGPLAACFLPGYLLMGVVPVVASMAGSALQG